MMEDYLRLDIPVFKPEYEDNVRYSFSNDAEKKRLKSLLCATTRGYCMYCYAKIKIDGRINADIEHGIEKVLSDKLIDCVPNLGLSCKTCNQSYKRKGELKKDNLPHDLKVALDRFHKYACDDPSLCRMGCDEYISLRECYSKYRPIILQPGIYSAAKSIIQYDVLKRRFIPSIYIDRTLIGLVQDHIDKFCLNDPRCRTMELVRFCKDVADGFMKPIKGRYNNLIVDLFVDKISGMEEKKYKAICNVILAQAAYKQDCVSIR